MSSKDISNNISNNIVIYKVDKVDKSKLRRNGIANIELTESYKEFIKFYKEKEDVKLS
jgi:hypothetical protein